jgi:hypothetical protein
MITIRIIGVAVVFAIQQATEPDNNDKNADTQVPGDSDRVVLEDRATHLLPAQPIEGARIETAPLSSEAAQRQPFLAAMIALTEATSCMRHRSAGDRG